MKKFLNSRRVNEQMDTSGTCVCVIFVLHFFGSARETRFLQSMVAEVKDNIKLNLETRNEK